MLDLEHAFRERWAASPGRTVRGLGDDRPVELGAHEMTVAAVLRRAGREGARMGVEPLKAGSSEGWMLISRSRHRVTNHGSGCA